MYIHTSRVCFKESHSYLAKLIYYKPFGTNVPPIRNAPASAAQAMIYGRLPIFSIVFAANNAAGMPVNPTSAKLR